MKHSNRGAIIALCIGLVVGIAFDGAFGYLALNTRRVADQVRVWEFHPSAATKEQIQRDEMTPEGRFLFLASHPAVESRRTFNQICSAVTTDTSILGCYVQPDKRIYLYHETDTRLDGTEEVAAAREMLRAAWDRFSPAERLPLLPQLRHALAADTDQDRDLAGLMASIRRNDPNDYDAELYATIGTEEPHVGSALEASYGRYFVERSAVTQLSAHSIAYLVALKHKVSALVSTINTLDTTITTEVTAFNAADAALGTDVDSFNARADRPGGFSSQGRFNVARAALVALDAALRTEVTQINAQIDTYNGDLGALKKLDKTALSLVKGLNIELDELPPDLSA